MFDKEKIIRLLFGELKDCNFKKKGGYLYKEHVDLFQMLKIEKNRWRPFFYLYFAVLFKELNDFSKVNISSCQFSINILDSLFEEIEQSDEALKLLEIQFPIPSIEDVLDLGTPMDEQERESELKRFIQVALIPLLKYCESTAHMKTLYQTGVLRRSFVYYKAAPLLGKKLDFNPEEEFKD